MLVDKLGSNIILPIHFCKKIYDLSKNLNDDLNLLHTDNSQAAIYELLYNAKTEYTKEVVKKLSLNYTTDVQFLHDSQKSLPFYRQSFSHQQLMYEG